MTLVEDCYRFSQLFPREEQYGLTSQIRRAAVSIPANIAEGYGRDSAGSYIRFLGNAQGSLKELGAPLIFAQRPDFGSFEKGAQLLFPFQLIGRMLPGLLRRVRTAQ